MNIYKVHKQYNEQQQTMSLYKSDCFVNCKQVYKSAMCEYTGINIK